MDAIPHLSYGTLYLLIAADWLVCAVGCLLGARRLHGTARRNLLLFALYSGVVALFLGAHGLLGPAVSRSGIAAVSDDQVMVVLSVVSVAWLAYQVWRTWRMTMRAFPGSDDEG